MQGSQKQFKTLITLSCSSVILCLQKKTKAASRKSSNIPAVGLPTSRMGASFPPEKVVRVAIPGRDAEVVDVMISEESNRSEVEEGSLMDGEGEETRELMDGAGEETRGETGMRRDFLGLDGKWTKGPGAGLFLVERREARTTEEWTICV